MPRAKPDKGRADASVVVSIFAMIFLVKPSISLGCAFFATLERDLEMILRPFLLITSATLLSLLRGAY